MITSVVFIVFAVVLIIKMMAGAYYDYKDYQYRKNFREEMDKEEETFDKTWNCNELKNGELECHRIRG